MTSRRFPTPWQVEQIPARYKHAPATTRGERRVSKPRFHPGDRTPCSPVVQASAYVGFPPEQVP